MGNLAGFAAAFIVLCALIAAPYEFSKHKSAPMVQVLKPKSAPVTQPPAANPAPVPAPVVVSAPAPAPVLVKPVYKKPVYHRVLKGGTLDGAVDCSQAPYAGTHVTDKQIQSYAAEYSIPPGVVAHYRVCYR